MKPKHLFKTTILLSSLIALNGCIVAAGVAGVEGVNTYAQDRTAGARVDDNAIAVSINKKFIDRGGKLFNEVNTQINEGRVLLTGKVQDPITRKDAEELTWQVGGVKEVINEIKVANEETFSNYVSDAWITQQIKARLLFTENIRSVNYGVETVDRVVYIMGIARTEQELKWVIEIARRTKGVQRVVNHAILINDPRRGIWAEKNNNSSSSTTTGSSAPGYNSDPPPRASDYDQEPSSHPLPN